ncbi:hypothetical protein BT93_A2284 [Corymbia citriodora subsp. variegata]|nr:hypothetical protein BT93_A2284 [Corymbia citriodora subsp. variegata]
MRAGGGCTVQHALTAEAATVVKQAVTLAKRRGHSQVTPLHVANTMLTSSTGLLKTACLQSHSHPLQCRALDLCFNVALNRLPAAAPSHVLGTHLQNPSISNALVAAFKRAQAHQRRGSIENQQQPILAVKIELEQLIISILDDPSVSRVMKEAGFSSAQVKSNVEQAVSSTTICSKNLTVTKDNSKGTNNNNLLVISHQPPLSSFDETGLVLGNTNAPDPVRNEDVVYVLENMANRRRKSIVVVGECLASVEGVVGAVMDKLDKGQDDVPQTIRNLTILNLSMNSFENMHREEADGRVEDLKRHVKSYTSNDDGGVVLYLGDLKWIAEYRASKFKGHQLERHNNYYCAVEHIIGEIAKLVSGVGGNGRLWLVGFATFQSYMRCKTGYPSIETLWCLHPLTIPAGSLSLSLITDSGPETDCIGKKAENRGPASPFEIVESRSSTTSSLPPWLQNYKDKCRRHCNNNDEEYACQKWNNFGKNPMFSSLPASPSASGYSHEHQNPNFHHFVHHEWPPTKLHSWRDHKFWNPPSESVNFVIELSSRSNSASSSEIMEVEYAPRFKELNCENLKTLCTELEKKVPWQKAIIPEIATTILRCRSGMSRRKLGSKCQNNASKQDTWFLFQGADAEAKEKVARELARLVFSSYISFSSITLSSFSSSTRAHSPENNGNKRLRDEHSSGYIEKFAEELSKNPHRVFFVEDVEEADYTAQMGFKRAMQRGRISSSVGDEVELSDAIVIFSCERSSSGSPTNFMLKSSHETRSCLSLDLNTLVEEDNAEDDDHDHSTDDIGLSGWVDGRVAFNVQ